jgi:hypothetical protein
LLKKGGIMMGINLYPPSLRAWGAIGVLTAWVGSLAWLAVRLLGQTESSTISSQASLRLGPAAAWYGLYAGETQVGSAGITLDTLSPGYRVLQTVTLEIPDDTGLVRATRSTETRLAGTLELMSVKSRYSRGGRQAEWYLVQAGDTLVARYASGTSSAHGEARFGGPISPASAFPYRLALSGALSQGNERTQTLMTGWPPAGRAAVARVGSDSTFRFADSSARDVATGRLAGVHFDSAKAYPVVLDGPTGPERLWVDRRGTIVAKETVFGMRWVRNDFEIAVQEFKRLLPQNSARIRGTLPTLTALSSQPDSDSSIVERRYRVEHADGRPIDRTLLALLAGGRQVVRGDTIIVGAEAFATRGGGFDDLAYDPMMQDNAREIIALGSQLRGTGPTRAALAALAATLHRIVRIDTSATAPFDALGALRAGRAQPDGFARLFVAVLRASGVPSRLVIGVSPLGDKLRTHAWAEVRESRGAGWLAVDPVFGHMPASTTLIRLSVGGSSHPEEMLALLADVKFIALGHSEILP